MKYLKIYIFALASLLSFSVSAQTEKNNLFTGSASIWNFKLPLDPSVGRCNIEVTVTGGPTVEQELVGPGFQGQISWTPENPGPVSLNWKGKTKFRGLNTVAACPGSGSLSEVVQPSADLIRRQWSQVMDKLNPQQKECLQIGMQLTGLLMESSDPNAKLTAPSDPATKVVYQKCDAFLAKKPKDSVPCNINSGVRSTCEESWRMEVDGRGRRLNFADAVQATFENKNVSLALFEKADVREVREKAENEAKAKAAAQLAAKQEAEEKTRKWLESPEYKKQQAEIAARQQAERLEAERVKAKQERDRIEAEKVAAEQKRKDEEARVRALANLKVKNVGLGSGPVPCTPEEATYVDIVQKPIRLQFECSFGSREDETQVIFAADRKTVVSVTRRQFLKPSDPEPSEVVKAAIRFYGPPVFHDDGNWTAMYGNPYTHSYNGRRINLSRNDQGVGLLIKGQLCADGSLGTARCGNLGTTLIEYELVNRAALLKSYEDGKDRLAAKNSNKINNQKF
jgi:hypothetical protein